MTENEIMKNVDACAQLLKSIKRKKILILKDKKEKMNLVCHDLDLIDKYKKDLSLLNLSEFKSIKISVNEGYEFKMETLVELEKGLMETKDLLEEKYDQMLYTLEKSLADYKEELGDNIIFHNVADVMVNSFNY